MSTGPFPPTTPYPTLHHLLLLCHPLFVVARARHLSLLVLLAVGLSSGHHVAERLLGLLPRPGLETAVGVDPELVGLEVLKHLRKAVLDLLLSGNTRGVDVVDTGANVARVGLVDEDLE